MSYTIRYSRFAQADLNRSFEWGIVTWGIDAAEAWLDSIEMFIQERLAEMPIAYPIAPEDVDFDHEIRQLIYGRYRILFTVGADEVYVLRIRGSFSRQSN